LQYCEGLLVIAQALIDKNPVDFIELHSHFGQLEQVFPHFACSGIIGQDTLEAGAAAEEKWVKYWKRYRMGPTRLR
jgi:hypothetical protein